LTIARASILGITSLEIGAFGHNKISMGYSLRILYLRNVLQEFLMEFLQELQLHGFKVSGI
jgi:hypothetical protein